MKSKIAMLILGASILSGCTLTPVKMYDGAAKNDSEVSKLRLWSEDSFIEKIDGERCRVMGNEPFAYILPGEHTVQVNSMRVESGNLLCGAFCDKSYPLTIEVKAGHSYIIERINPKENKYKLIDKGENYNEKCLNQREYVNQSNC